MDHLTLNDLFVVGLALEITGGWLLGRGLLASPLDLARRAGAFMGANPHAVVSAAENKVDGAFGLGALLGGFAVQAVGYFLIIGNGGGDEIGWCRALVAAGLGMLAAVALLVAWMRSRRRLVLRTLRGPARYDVNSGEMVDIPFAWALCSYAEALGCHRREGEDNLAFARRVYGDIDFQPRVA